MEHCTSVAIMPKIPEYENEDRSRIIIENIPYEVRNPDPLIKKPVLSIDLESTDLMIIALMSQGLKQSEVSKVFKISGHKPSSLRYIEKSLNKMRSMFGAKTNFHLAVILKEKGLL